MSTPSWLRRLSRRHLTAAARPRFRPAVNQLEDRCTPSIALTGISVPAVNENGSATLTGTIAGRSIGDMTATVNWGDGTSADVFTVPAGSTTFTRTHVYLDDNPTNTASDNYPVTASIVDNGPSVITGPNTAGYRAYDEPFWNIDMSTGGTGITTLISTNQDDVTAVYDLGGDSFTYYGTTYTGNNQLNVVTNGLITFGAPIVAGSPNYTNTALATSTIAQPIIATFWDDLTTDAGNVLVRKVDVDGNGVNDFLIVEWNNVKTFAASTNPITFQAVLQLNTGANNGDIVFNYVNTLAGSAAGDYGASATIGIKNSGTFDPVQVAFNPVGGTNFARPGNAIRFSTQNISTSALAGPNTFGYRSQKSFFLAPGNNLDLTGSGTGVTTITPNNNDDTSNPYDLGTNVLRFYNTNYTGANKLYVGVNGLISFGVADGEYQNAALSGRTQAVIAPYWTDMHTSTGSGAILAKLVDLDANGTNDYLILEWSQVTTYNDQNIPANNATFQVILQLNTGNAPGDIVFNYVDTTFSAGNAANTGGQSTIGIKDANSPGPADVEQLSLNTAYAPVADGNTISFIRTATPSVSTTVTVNNVAPAIASLTATPATINENQSTTINGTFTDPGTLDTHVVTIVWQDGSPNTVLNLAAGTLTFSATHQYLDDTPTGTASDVKAVQVTVADDDLGSVTSNVNVTVNNVAPTITSFTALPTTINEGQSTTVNGAFTDPGTLDTHTVTITWNDGSPNTVLNLAAGTLTFSSTHAYADDNPTGTASDVVPIQVTVADDDLGSASTSTNITVSNVAPTITSLPTPAAINENGTVTVSGTLSDPGTLDTHTVTFVWQDGTPNTVVSLAAGVTTFSTTHQYLDDNPTATSSDIYAVGVTVADDDTGSASSSVNVTVNNVAPTITTVSATTINENQSTTLSGTIADVGTQDTHAVTIVWQDGSPNTVLNLGVGVLTFSTTHQYVDDNPTGTASDVVGIQVTVADDDLGSVSGTANVTINNVAPTITALSATATTINENDSTTINGTIADVGTLDTHTVTINWRDGTPNTVLNLGAGLTFSATHQYLDDTPTGTASDVMAIQVTVADDDLGTVTGTTNVTVNNVAPTITSFTAAPPTANEGQLASVNGTFTDVGTLDTHRVTINWNDGSPNTVLNLAAGTLTFSSSHAFADDNPTGTPSDVVAVQVTVADDDTGSASTSGNITVNNVAPTVVINGAPASSPEGTPITLTAGVTDPGTLDTFTYAWAVTKNGSALGFTGQGTGTVVLTPDDNGTYVVHLTVTDDDTGVGVAPAVTITATNVAPAPTLAVVPITGPEGSPLSVTATPHEVGTVDQATLTYNWTVTKNGNPYAGFTGQGTAHIVLTPDDNGTFVATVAVTDKDGGVGTASQSIAVTNVNPTATFGNDGPKPANTNINFTFANQFDPSTVDTAAGFTYSYDFNNDGNFTSPGDVLNSPSPAVAFAFPTFGTYTVRGRIADKDGGFSDYTTTVTIIPGNTGVVATHLYATGAGAGGGSHVRVYNLDGTERFEFLAYNSSFAGGVRVATGDVNGDGVEDIVTAPGVGGGPDIRVFSGVNGALIREFMAYGATFGGGVYVAVADVNHDGFADIITGAGAGGGPHVKVFSGWDNGLMKSFFAYTATFSGGVNVAGGDIDGDGFAEVITGAGPTGGPHVKAFSGKTDAVLASFFAFSPTFSAGVSVAAGDVTHDGKADIIVGTGPDSTSSAVVRVFDGVNLAIVREFVAYPGLLGGVRVGAVDANGDGISDILVAPGVSNGSVAPPTLLLNGATLEAIRTFTAYDPTFLGGVYVG